MSLRYLKNVSNIKYFKDKCIGCGMCVKVCPHQVFGIEVSGNVKKATIIEKDACIECGACSKNCPAHAIEVKVGVG